MTTQADFYQAVIKFVVNEIWQRAVAAHEAQQDAYTRQLWDARRDLILRGVEIACESSKTERV